MTSMQLIDAFLVGWIVMGFFIIVALVLGS